MSSELEVFSDLSERLNYNLQDFPLYVRSGTLRQFDRYAAACHWHADLEFILVQEGAMDYFVNGQTVSICKGNGIFVNSRRLHYGFSTDNTDCSYIVVAIHPVLLGEGTYTGKMYLEEKFGANSEDFILLKNQIPWQQEVLLLMNEMYTEMHSKVCSPLRLLSQSASLCASIGDQVQQFSSHLVSDESWMAVWKMTEFVHQHYDIKIKLDDIAAAGNVCRSRCCELFGRYLGQTPNTYLMRYRMKKSCEMLLETNRSILEIAMACGFQSPSYFSYSFRKEIGLVPQYFRKQSTISETAPPV
jgi:AraC-like DNA-binding protein